MRKVLMFVMALSLAGVGCSDGSGTQDVTITFGAVVGTQAFVCGNTYENLGANETSLQVSDFRYVVQSIELNHESGDYVAVSLEDNDWQAEGTTLLDFEDGCSDLGTEEMNTSVTGTVPAGTYDGIRFQMGVPFEANHDNTATAPSPLNRTSMNWSWQDGYKFLRIDSGNFSPDDWRLHLGSTGCDGDPVSGGTTECSAPNRVDVELDTFAPESDTVIADLAALVDGASLDENQPETPVGCMAGPSDSDCAPLFNNLGLPFGDSDPSGPQTFFSVD